MPAWDPKANEIFGRALQCAAPAAVEAPLDEACGTDAALRDEVTHLLASHEAAGSFLQKPAVRVDPAGYQNGTAATATPGVLDDFRILREIGRGGMGIVYEAEQLSLGRRMALKVLPLAATLSVQQLQQFKNEARLAASLQHPHIVSVHSVGVERGVHYYAMELVGRQKVVRNALSKTLLR